MEVVLEFIWNQVKEELRQQLISYAEDFNVNLMHQGDQKGKQYKDVYRVT